VVVRTLSLKCTSAVRLLTITTSTSGSSFSRETRMAARPTSSPIAKSTSAISFFL